MKTVFKSLFFVSFALLLFACPPPVDPDETDPQGNGNNLGITTEINPPLIGETVETIDGVEYTVKSYLVPSQRVSTSGSGVYDFFKFYYQNQKLYLTKTYPDIKNITTYYDTDFLFASNFEEEYRQSERCEYFYTYYYENGKVKKIQVFIQGNSGDSTEVISFYEDGSQRSFEVKYFTPSEKFDSIDLCLPGGLGAYSKNFFISDDGSSDWASESLYYFGHPVFDWSISTFNYDRFVAYYPSGYIKYYGEGNILYTYEDEKLEKVYDGTVKIDLNTTDYLSKESYTDEQFFAKCKSLRDGFIEDYADYIKEHSVFEEVDLTLGFSFKE